MELCQPYFRQMEEIRDFNQLKMLKAFADTQMSSTDMLGTTGYGLWDTGRAKLEQIFCAGHGRRGCTGAQPVPKRHPHAGGGAVRSAAGRGHPAGRHRPPLRYAGGRHWSEFGEPSSTPEQNMYMKVRHASFLLRTDISGTILFYPLADVRYIRFSAARSSSFICFRNTVSSKAICRPIKMRVFSVVCIPSSFHQQLLIQLFARPQANVL